MNMNFYFLPIALLLGAGSAFAHPTDQDLLNVIGVNTKLRIKEALNIPATYSALHFSEFSKFHGKPQFTWYGTAASEHCSIKLNQVADYDREIARGTTYKIIKVKKGGSEYSPGPMYSRETKLFVDSPSISYISCWGTESDLGGGVFTDGYPTIGTLKKYFPASVILNTPVQM